MKIMRTKNVILTTLAFSALTACVQVPQEAPKRDNQLAISSVRDMPTRYAQGSTFELSPKYVKETSLKPEQTQNVYKRYANQIISNLQSNGFAYSNGNQPAVFHVGFGVALADDLTDDTISEKFGITPGLQPSNELAKGSFLIYIDDATSGKRVWRGAVQGFVQEKLTPEQREQRTAHIVKLVLSQFYAKN